MFVAANTQNKIILLLETAQTISWSGAPLFKPGFVTICVCNIESEISMSGKWFMQRRRTQHYEQGGHNQSWSQSKQGYLEKQYQGTVGKHWNLLGSNCQGFYDMYLKKANKKRQIWSRQGTGNMYIIYKQLTSDGLLRKLYSQLPGWNPVCPLETKKNFHILSWSHIDTHTLDHRLWCQGAWEESSGNLHSHGS